MKKISIGILFFGVIAGNVLAIDPVQFEVLHRYSNGSGVNEFRYYSVEGMGSNPSAPEGLAYVEGDFYITDNVNERIVKISRDGEWDVFYAPVEPGIRLIPKGKLLFDLYTQGMYRIYDIEENTLLTGGDVRVGNAGFFFHSVIAGDMLLVNIASSQANPEYYGFYIADNFEGKITMMNPDETIKFLTEEYRGTEKFTVQDGYIFWNGRLVAPYGPIYFQYYYGSRENNLTLWNAMQQRRFIGWDNMGNSYWDNAGRRVNVFTPSGKLIADFYGENVNPYEKSQFAVAPDGSLYCLSYNMDQDKFELMKLERFW